MSEIFHALTGSNYISFKVKEDPSKNKNLLRFITANEKKNFIIYAEKRLASSISEQEEGKTEIFTILSQKSVQAGIPNTNLGIGLDQSSSATNEVLLRMKR